MSDPRDSKTLEAEPSGLLALADRLNALKSVPRTGWLDRGVDPALVESVADHTTGVALLAWACAIQRNAGGAAIDPARVLLLAMLHDLAEAEIGDLTPYDRSAVPEESEVVARRAFLDRRHVRDAARSAQKRAAEDEAMRSLVEALPLATREDVTGLWEELRDGSTDEARFVKQVDRLETFLQSLHYQHANAELPMESFRKEAIATISDPLLASIRDAALARHEAE